MVTSAEVGAGAAAAVQEEPRATVASRVGWTVFVVVLVALFVTVLLTMETGLPEDSPLANPNPGPAPYPFSPMAEAVPQAVMMGGLAVTLFGVLGWLSWRRRRLHWALIIALGTMFTGLVDPLANWATFASLNPAAYHVPTDWVWFRLAPLSEPALSLIGGYSAYYLLTGFALYWISKKLVLSRASAASWVGRHPLVALFVTAWIVAVPLTALQQWQWLDAGMLVYTQFAGPVVHIGHVQLPLLILLYDPFVFATVALMCYRDERNESVVLTKLAALLPGRAGRRRATSGRQVFVAAILMMASILLPTSGFALVRVSGLADEPTYDEYPFPEAKVYDPYGDLERAGKPGPFVR